MHVKFIFTRFVCCGQITAFDIFQVTLVWDSGQIRASELLPDNIFRTYIIFCSPVRWFIALSLKLTSSDYHCAVISLLSYYYWIYLIVTRTSSCHTFKEAKANGGSPQLSSPSYSPIIVPFRRVGGNLVMKLTHKGDRERPSKSLGSGEHLATLRSHWTLTDGLPA
jgi:hypothetical protein